MFPQNQRIIWYVESSNTKFCGTADWLPWIYMGGGGVEGVRVGLTVWFYLSIHDKIFKNHFLKLYWNNSFNHYLLM